jgi:hypothetical protein
VTKVKDLRKKVWDRIKLKWLTFTGKRPYTELIDDIANASKDELDDMLKVYRYKDNFGSALAGIRADPVVGKDIVMKATGAAGPAGPAGNPLSIAWQSPLSFSSTTNTAFINLSHYVNTTTFSNYTALHH